MTTKTKEVKEVSVDDKLDQLIDIVSGVADRVKALEEIEPVATEVKAYEPKTSVPNRYVQIVLQILGPRFGIEKELDEETYGTRANNEPNLYHLIVPEDYSTLTESEREMGMRDIRSKAIDGDDDLKNYCSLVRNQIIKYHQKEGKPLPIRGFE